MRIDSQSVVEASHIEGQGDMLALKAYRESSDVRARLECLRKAAECYEHSYEVYRKASMPMFAKAVRRKGRDILEAIEFEARHRGSENPILKDIIGRLLRNKDFRARLGLAARQRA